MGLVVFLVTIVVALGVAGFMFGLYLHRKRIAGDAELAAELAREPAIRGPERGVYRGTTGSYSKVMGNGKIVLTGKRLIFVKLTGGRVDVQLTEVTAVQRQKVFNRGVVGTRTHLVVHTRSGDVGYFVDDLDGWLSAISSAARLS